MELYLLVTVIVFGTVASLRDWHSGIYWMVLVGTLQDPIRKLTPDAPPEFVLSILPIWCAMVLGGIIHKERLIERVRRVFPRMYRSFGIFLITIVPGLCVSLSYGGSSWKVAALGTFFFMSPMIGIVLGYNFPRNPSDLKKFLGFYCMLTAAAMVGTFVEQLGTATDWPAIGTASMKTTWVRYTGEHTIRMLAGFYRSPDIMGWHAATLACLATALSSGERGGKRVVWGLAFGWACLAAWACVRRKMFIIIPLSFLIFGYVQWRSGRLSRLSGLIGIMLVAGCIAALVAAQLRFAPEIGGYYATDPEELLGRSYDHAYGETAEAIGGTAGLFGLGVGSTQLGARYVNAEKARTWTEGGLGRIAEEVGVVGTAGFIVMMMSVLAAIVGSLMAMRIRSEEDYHLAIIGALVIANGATFVISGHVFNDPFINCLFSFLAGVAISGRRQVLVKRGRRLTTIDQKPPAPPRVDVVRPSGADGLSRC
jgi:hypothetical protein